MQTSSDVFIGMVSISMQTDDKITINNFIDMKHYFGQRSNICDIYPKEGTLINDHSIIQQEDKQEGYSQGNYERKRSDHNSREHTAITR